MNLKLALAKRLLFDNSALKKHTFQKTKNPNLSIGVSL